MLLAGRWLSSRLSKGRSLVLAPYEIERCCRLFHIVNEELRVLALKTRLIRVILVNFILSLVFSLLLQDRLTLKLVFV